MAINIEKILSAKDAEKLSKEAIANINEAIAAEYSNRKDALEKEMAAKFETLVEGLSTKFVERVNGVITESVKDNLGTHIDKKFYGIVKDMVNLLENAGITTTEKTKELKEKLTMANDKLVKSWGERVAVKGQLDDAEKDNYTFAQTKGMRPEVVNAAIEWGKDKSILDIQDQLQVFLDGD